MSVPEKAPYGSPCNGCGLCCLSHPCRLGTFVTGVIDDACPALVRDSERYACGLITQPRRFAPVLTAINGVQAMSRAAALLIGAGKGCDAQEPGEADSPVWRARAMHERAVEMATGRAAAAWLLWGAR